MGHTCGSGDDIGEGRWDYVKEVEASFLHIPAEIYDSLNKICEKGRTF